MEVRIAKMPVLKKHQMPRWVIKRLFVLLFSFVVWAYQLDYISSLWMEKIGNE